MICGHMNKYVLVSVSGLALRMSGEVAMKRMGTVVDCMSTYDMQGQNLRLKARAKDNNLSIPVHMYLIMLDSSKAWHDSVVNRRFTVVSLAIYAIFLVNNRTFAITDWSALQTR